MSKHQSRRSVSISGATYATVRADCESRGLSLSRYVEALIAADHKERRVVPAGAVLRQSARTENAVSKAVRAAGVVSGRGQYQQVQSEVRKVAERLPLGVGLPVVERVMRGFARAAVAKRVKEATTKPLPIPEGRDVAGAGGREPRKVEAVAVKRGEERMW